jgi:shikimate dehydrogenase
VNVASRDETIFFRLGLIGYPLGHSLSPRLHQAALEEAGLQGEYQLYPIPPGSEEIAVLLGRLRTGALHGLNVTIPHKQAVLPILDGLSEVAQAVGAANTLYLDPSGCLVGENTDVPGFLRDLERQFGRSLSGKGEVVVLGAGGSARAVVYGLANAGWQVRVLARRAEQAHRLAEEIKAVLPERGSITGGPLSAEVLANDPSFDLLVNTTPLGMDPDVSGCPWPDEIPLPKAAAVYDLVYNPIETRLLRRARQEGLPAANGAGMLCAQAALAFQIWTGVDAPFDRMERAFYQPTT